MDNAEGSPTPSIFSSTQISTLVGTLLGDGCLAKHGRFHRLHVKHKLAQRALAELKYKVFRDIISMPLHHFDQQLLGKRYPCVQFATRTNPLLSEWHARFYRAGKKQLPTRICEWLTPLAVAVWFMDDGAADHAGLTFQTHSFDLDEVEVLAEGLREKFDLAVNLRRNRGAWLVYVKAESVERFRHLTEQHILPELTYKLRPRNEVL